MSGLAAALFFVGLLFMGADGPGPLTWAQVLANISGLVLFAVSMTMMKNLKQNQKI
jgi:drug/metabolite transporter (DMT)-like permease